MCTLPFISVLGAKTGGGGVGVYVTAEDCGLNCISNPLFQARLPFYSPWNCTFQPVLAVDPVFVVPILRTYGFESDRQPLANDA